VLAVDSNGAIAYVPFQPIPLSLALLDSFKDHQSSLGRLRTTVLPDVFEHAELHSEDVNVRGNFAVSPIKLGPGQSFTASNSNLLKLYMTVKVPADVMVVGIRFHLGKASPNSIPNEVHISCGTLELSHLEVRELHVPRWFDCPFSLAQAENITARTDSCVVYMSASTAGLQMKSPTIDEIQVYTMLKSRFREMHSVSDSSNGQASQYPNQHHSLKSSTQFVDPDDGETRDSALIWGLALPYSLPCTLLSLRCAFKVAMSLYLDMKHSPASKEFRLQLLKSVLPHVTSACLINIAPEYVEKDKATALRQNSPCGLSSEMFLQDLYGTDRAALALRAILALQQAFKNFRELWIMNERPGISTRAIFHLFAQSAFSITDVLSRSAQLFYDYSAANAQFLPLLIKTSRLILLQLPISFRPGILPGFKSLAERTVSMLFSLLKSLAGRSPLIFSLEDVDEKEGNLQSISESRLLKPLFVLLGECFLGIVGQLYSLHFPDAISKYLSTLVTNQFAKVFPARAPVDSYTQMLKGTLIITKNPAEKSKSSVSSASSFASDIHSLQKIIKMRGTKYRCNLCHHSPVTEVRWNCLDDACKDFNLCQTCFVNVDRFPDSPHRVTHLTQRLPIVPVRNIMNFIICYLFIFS
jgi:hypothetical protein